LRTNHKTSPFDIIIQFRGLNDEVHTMIWVQSAPRKAAHEALEPDYWRCLWKKKASYLDMRLYNRNKSPKQQQQEHFTIIKDGDAYCSSSERKNCDSYPNNDNGYSDVFLYLLIIFIHLIKIIYHLLVHQAFDLVLQLVLYQKQENSNMCACPLAIHNVQKKIRHWQERWEQILQSPLIFLGRINIPPTCNSSLYFLLPFFSACCIPCNHQWHSVLLFRSTLIPFPKNFNHHLVVCDGLFLFYGYLVSW
jgi:hypothetical protein